MEEHKEPPPPYSPAEPPKVDQPLGHQAMHGYQGGACPFPQALPTVNTPNRVPFPSGYQAVPASCMPNYGSTIYVNQGTPVFSQVTVVGGCPVCKVGVLEDDFTCLGILLAILFFPIGILCCLALQGRRCSNCGAVFS